MISEGFGLDAPHRDPIVPFEDCNASISMFLWATSQKHQRIVVYLST